MGKLRLIIIFFTYINAFAQDTSYWKHNYPNQHWQNQKDWDAPGNYEIASKLSKTVVYQGDNIDLDIYITGYGIIGNSKIYFLFSDTFYSSKSFVKTSIKISNNQFTMGTDSFNLNNGPNFYLTLNGLKDSTWPYKTFYADMDTQSYRILSEMNVGHPPVSMHIKLKSNLKPEDYSIKLFYTYFNGHEWKSSEQTLSFHVNTWIEQHYIVAWLLGIVISFIGLITIVPTIIELGSKFRKAVFENKTEEKTSDNNGIKEVEKSNEQPKS